MTGNEIIITDAGITFPSDDMTGIDYIIPDFPFLKKNESKIKKRSELSNEFLNSSQYKDIKKWVHGISNILSDNIKKEFFDKGFIVKDRNEYI